MTAPVIFYMFLNVFAPLVINDHFLTTLIFDEPVIRPHTGASASNIYLEISPDSKMIFIKAKGKELNTNLNVPTKSGKLYSFLIRSGKLPHSIVQVKDGKMDNTFKDVKKSRGVMIQESTSIARVLNQSKFSVMINSISLPPNARLELPKGAPVYINGKRIHR